MEDEDRGPGRWYLVLMTSLIIGSTRHLVLVARLNYHLGGSCGLSFTNFSVKKNEFGELVQREKTILASSKLKLRMFLQLL